jgi:ankyrin repeat protein
MLQIRLEGECVAKLYYFSSRVVLFIDNICVFFACPRTPLHVAVQCDNADFVQLILSHNIVVNAQDVMSNTALHYAESVDMAEMLLSSGCSPNIPNCDGLCALHLAVKRRDFSLVKCLLTHGADVTNADDVCWFTPLHFIARADTSSEPAAPSLRGPIAELLCEAKHSSSPDLNYQDRDGNTPLHHAASLAQEDAAILISLFIEHGSCPKIVNNRGQTPIHIFCHNNSVRQYAFYPELLHLMLENGANPNQQSMSGCTPLHLSLYHKDLESAALLTRYGADLNVAWKKPLGWDVFWTDMESNVVLPLDMIEDVKSLHSVIAEVSSVQSPAPHRSKCMHCKTKFKMLSRKHNCNHCGRSICGRCTSSLQASFFPYSTLTERGKNIVGGLIKVCILCEAMLLSQGVSSTVPSSIVHDENDSELSIGTISM